jgi:hypothetical protein
MKKLLVLLSLTLMLLAPLCKPAVEVDNDQDGYTVSQGDCDDNDAQTFPGAYELCDKKDNDCSGKVDDGQCAEQGDPTLNQDQDGDGYTPKQGDCNDKKAAIYPGARELCDQLDNDCNGLIDDSDNCKHTKDLDWDNFSESQGDCSDYDATMNPNFPEICNDYKDNNCDGQVDEKECLIDDVPIRFYASGSWSRTVACSGICAYVLDFWVDVKLKNLAYVKDVWIEMADNDAWKNSQSYSLHYKGDLSDGYERWGADVSSICQWSSNDYPGYGGCSRSLFRYKIYYKVNGETYWDDNSGRGFTANADYYYID